MTTRHPLAGVVRASILAVAVGAVAWACGSSAPATPAASFATLPPSSAPAEGSSPVAPSLTPVPGGPASPAVGPSGAGGSAGPPTTTDTEFGTIFDELPSTFPKLPGQTPADPGSGPTSGTFAVHGDPTTASSAMKAALEGQGWTVDVGTPLEDGTVVLDATGASSTCKSEVRFTPVSGTVVMSVLYGASCPFS